MGLRGDYGELRLLRARIARLAEPVSRLTMSKNLAEAARTQTVVGFAKSVAPNEKKWAKLTSRTGQPLLDTGTHLRNSISPKAYERGFTLSTAFVGARVHQYGATIRAKKRKYLRFQVRGRPTKRRPRGNPRDVFVESVTIPARPYLPIDVPLGRRWTSSLTHAADTTMMRLMGRA
jgi:phage gpG-like protein